MQMPCYISVAEARALLTEMGISVSDAQIRRAASPDALGKRRLPFFVDPIDGRLKIEKGTLVRIYRELQIEAEQGT